MTQIKRRSAQSNLWFLCHYCTGPPSKSGREEIKKREGIKYAEHSSPKKASHAKLATFMFHKRKRKKLERKREIGTAFFSSPKAFLWVTKSIFFCVAAAATTPWLYRWRSPCFIQPPHLFHLRQLAEVVHRSIEPPSQAPMPAFALSLSLFFFLLQFRFFTPTGKTWITQFQPILFYPDFNTLFATRTTARYSLQIDMLVPEIKFQHLLHVSLFHGNAWKIEAALRSSWLNI